MCGCGRSRGGSRGRSRRFKRKKKPVVSIKATGGVNISGSASVQGGS